MIFLILTCFVNNSRQYASFDITLVFHINEVNQTKFAAEFYQQWNNLKTFFIHHFSLTNSTTESNRIQICISAYDKLKWCGGKNREIFMDNLADFELKLNHSFALDEQKSGHHFVIGMSFQSFVMKK